MKNIPLLTCLVIVLFMALSACVQTSVTVKPADKTGDKSSSRPTPSVQRRYEPIARDRPYVVQAGDTLYGISFRAGLAYREVAAWNNIAEPYTVKIGQRILLQPADTLIVNNISAASTVAADMDIKPVDIKSPVVVTSPAETVASAETSAVKPVVSRTSSPATEKPVSVNDNRPVVTSTALIWCWPSEGMVISRYVQGDTNRQGINIGGKSGQPIHASANGIVVYSGAGLVGYGELIIIKHSNEWLSAYAHNRLRLVAEGTKVKAGDVIAEMGRTGTMRDMLHFEIRRNGKPVDPLLYLPKQ